MPVQSPVLFWQDSFDSRIFAVGLSEPCFVSVRGISIDRGGGDGPIIVWVVRVSETVLTTN